MQASYQEGKRWSEMPSLFLSQNDSQKTQKCFIWDFNSYKTFLRRKRFIPNAPPCASAFRTYAIRCWLRLNKLLSPASSRTQQLSTSEVLWGTLRYSATHRSPRFIPIHRDESRFGLHRCRDGYSLSMFQIRDGSTVAIVTSPIRLIRRNIQLLSWCCVWPSEDYHDNNWIIQGLRLWGFK